MEIPVGKFSIDWRKTDLGFEVYWRGRQLTTREMELLWNTVVEFFGGLDQDNLPLEEQLIDDSEGLSTRAYNRLYHTGIRRIGQLTKMTEADLLSIAGLGRKTLREIKAFLKQLGLSLKE